MDKFLKILSPASFAVLLAIGLLLMPRPAARTEKQALSAACASLTPTAVNKRLET